MGSRSKGGSGLLAIEALCFALMLALIWVDQILDLPSVILGMAPTPICWGDAFFESAIALFIGGLVMFMTAKLGGGKKQEEAVVLVCAVCRKVNKAGRWMTLDDFISENSSGTFSHGICPDCMDTYYKGVTDTTALNFKQFLKYRKP